MTTGSGWNIVAAARALRQGTITSVALTESCLDRIASIGPGVNAFITVTGEEAVAAARRADAEFQAGHDRGPLHGIPLSLKDLIHQAGVPTTAASRVRPLVPEAADAPVTARLREAGAVLVGKTNLHEFAFGTTSEDSAFGPVRHPLDPARLAGGSSGGSAVAVATGMSLAALGTDTGGSIRIPAAACGCVGLKPTFGEVSTDGVIPLAASLDHVGPIARTVADAALVQAVLTGRPPVVPAPRSLAGVRLGRLRGYFEELLEDGVRVALDEAVTTLARVGAVIEDVELPHAPDIAQTYLHIVLPEAAATHRLTLESCPERYSPIVRARLEMGRQVTAEDQARATRMRVTLTQDVEQALAGRDGLILATLPIVAPRMGASEVVVGGRTEPVRAVMLRLTQLFDLTGHPAISLPSGPTGAGLPVGLQLVGHHGRTGDLLALALAAEAALGSS